MKMDVRYNNPFVNELEEPGFVSDVMDSPPTAGVYKERRLNSISSPKKSKRGVHKRVVTVPITDAHGSRLKGEGTPPPSDSWAWRKYGQKPIKGSPYPRGYYRCSSSKGCPARKQVERSRLDPTVLVITYACEHNHTWPAASKYTTARATNTTTTAVDTEEEQNNALPEEVTPVLITRPGSKLEPETRFADLGDESLITTDDYDFSWFSDVESTILNTTPMYTEDSADVAMIFPIMREEDESLFADLGELPECSLVFKESRRCSSSLRAYCESTR